LNKKILKIALLLCVCVSFAMPVNRIKAATAKEYGILLADSKGSYTYYDFNGAKGSQRIEIAPNGTVMIPLRAVVGQIKTFSYTYDWNKCQATIKNNKTGVSVVVTKGSQYAKIYSKKSSKPKNVKMAYKMYLSKSSNAAMVDKEVFKQLFSTTQGYRYYTISNKAQKKSIVNAGYDTPVLKGLLIWNPYKKVTAIPNATKVKYSAAIGLTDIVKITIPEGYSVSQIVDLFVKKGVCKSSSALFKAANTVSLLENCSYYDKELNKTNRVFLTEGYLYCSTYEVYRNSSPETIIAKLIKGSEQLITAQDIERATELGYTVDEILRVASIIEKEVGKASERTKVASILYNRLNSNTKIQCDCTINYIEKYVKPYIKGDKDRYNTLYNTYKCRALPEGPICNPSKGAVRAALYPEETNYMFFFSDPNGNYVYSESCEEHMQKYQEAYGL